MVSPSRPAKECARFLDDIAVTTKEPQLNFASTSTPNLVLVIGLLDFPGRYHTAQHTTQRLLEIPRNRNLQQGFNSETKSDFGSLSSWNWNFPHKRRHLALEARFRDFFREKNGTLVGGVNRN
jgi:hypothetical protein